MEQSTPTFERDIRPLFREKDIQSMSRSFELDSYEDVRTHADGIYSHLADGSMPCDGAWSPENVGLFRQWIDAGFPK